MPRPRLALLAAALALYAATACGGTEVTAGDIVPLEEAPDRFAAAYCGRLFSCCDAGELAQKLAVLGAPQPTTAAECATRYGAAIRPMYDLMAGDARLAYDSRQMGRCVAAVNAVACVDLDVAGEEDFQRACNLVFDGRIAVGLPCAVPSDCQGPAVCAGTCERLAQDGESCADVGCDVALFCDTTRTCRKQRREGESCVLATDCQSNSCDGTKCVISTPHLCTGP